MRRFLKALGWTVTGIVVVALAAIAWLARPIGSQELQSHPHPSASYQQSVQRLTRIKTAEKSMPLQPVGHSIMLLQPSQVETAVVIFHGYTDVPDQFAVIAKGYADSGASVYVPRMPYHGYANRMTDDQSKINPEVLRKAADDAIDIGAGLGRNVVVVGLSGGGAMAAWAAAERPDVAQTVIISPLMLPKAYKPWMVRPMARAVALMPDSYNWWDEAQKDKAPGPEYPRYSLHGITSYLMMVERAKANGKGGATPVVGDVTMVTNLSDQHLNTEYPVAVMRPLVRPDRSFRVVTIPRSEKLLHDIVGTTGDNRPRLRRAYHYLSQALGIPLPDPLAHVAGK